MGDGKWGGGGEEGLLHANSPTQLRDKFLLLLKKRFPRKWHTVKKKNWQIGVTMIKETLEML